MKSLSGKDIAELIGITAIVVSLIFVGLQIRQAEDIANATRRSSVIANRIELTNAINEHADIWSRGNAGEQLDDAEIIIFENLVWSKYRFHQGEFAAASHLKVEGGMRSHATELAVYLYENPGARRVLNERDLSEIWSMPLSEDFSDTVDGAMELLNKSEH